MNWLTIAWSLSAGACLALGLMHLLISFKSRTAGAHLAFAIAALSVVGIALSELMLIKTRDPQRYVQIVLWTQVPLMVLMLSLVCFVGLYFRTGRMWLGGMAVGLRLVSLGLNLIISAGDHLANAQALREVNLLGEPVMLFSGGTSLPWSWVADLSSLLLLLFVLDAAIRLWRNGGRDNRRKALVVGCGVTIFVLVGASYSWLIDSKGLQTPYLISFSFLAIILAMAHELSQDVISAARLAEELHENQQQMTLAARAAKLAIWVWDITNNQIWVTPEGRRMMGASAETELTVEYFLATVHPDDRERVQLALKHCRTEGDSFEADYRLRTPDGSIRWITSRGRVERNGGSKPLRLLGVSKDITERKMADELAKLVLEAAPNAIIMVDSTARMVLVNRQAELTFGYSRGEMLGNPIEMLIPARLSQGHPALRQSFFTQPSRRGMGTGRELFGLRKDGSEMPVEVGLNPIETAEGRFVLASVIDITERLRAEKEVTEQRAELMHLSRVSSLGQLSGSLAHELNQPLAIILSNAEAAQQMLEAESPDIPELKEILKDIISEDLRAGEVIKSLRALLKRGETLLLPVSLNDATADVLRMLRSDLIGRGVTVHTDFAEPLPQVLGDYVQLQQVLMNLISNACDALLGNERSDRRLYISTQSFGNKVSLTVRDQGCGLPEGGVEQIFQPFFTTKRQGLGIGLAICRSIIASHHGRLWAESLPGQGTLLHMELPVAETRA